MTVEAVSPRSGRRLTAAGRARREKRATLRRQRAALAAVGVLTAVLAAPLSIAAYMGVDATIPGMEAAKSFMAMMSERSPGDRTKAELTKSKHHAVAEKPAQRALGKITKPAPPKEFEEAISPPLPALEELPPVALKDDIGPLLLTPQPPGGGIIAPPQAPPGGGGGNPTPPGEEPPVTPPPPPPPAVPEPGTWATMLLGFGLTGWVMRRRRRTSAALNLG